MTKSPLHLQNVALAGPQHLGDRLMARIPAGAEITSLTLFCTSDLPDRVLCLIGFRNAPAREVADALHGQPFAFDSAVISVPVGIEFICRSRPRGETFTVRS